MLFPAVLGDVVRLRTVNRVEGVNRREAAVVAGDVVGAVLVVHADQHAVVHRPGVEAAVDLVIQGDGVHLLVRAGIAAIQLGVIQPACGIHLVQLDFGVQVAQLLAHRPAAVKQVLDVIADHVFPTIVLVVIVLALEEGVGDFLTAVRYNGALIWQAGVAAAFRIAVQVGHQIQTGAVGDTPGQARHQGVTLFFERIELGISIAGHPAEAHRHAVVIINRAGHVEHRPTLVIVTGEELNLPARIERWLTGGERHNPARR